MRSRYIADRGIRYFDSPQWGGTGCLQASAVDHAQLLFKFRQYGVHLRLNPRNGFGERRQDHLQAGILHCLCFRQGDAEGVICIDRRPSYPASAASRLDQIAHECAEVGDAENSHARPLSLRWYSLCRPGSNSILWAKKIFGFRMAEKILRVGSI